LAPLLFAAESSGRSITDAVRWVDAGRGSRPARGRRRAEAYFAAEATWKRDERRRSSIYTTAETVLGAYADPGVLDGHAADFGMAARGGSDDGPMGDRIMAACLIASSMPRDQAVQTVRRGGLYSLQADGLGVWCTWKTDAGGNHHNHVHAGARPDG